MGSGMAEHMIGQRYPLHASSTRKVLLAEMSDEKIAAVLPAELPAFTEHTITDHKVLLRELRQIREQGFGVIDNELEEGLLSLSRPVRDASGTMVAILTVNAPRYRFGRDRIPETLQYMQQTVDKLVDALWQDSAG